MCRGGALRRCLERPFYLLRHGRCNSLLDATGWHCTSSISQLVSMPGCPESPGMPSTVQDCPVQLCLAQWLFRYNRGFAVQVLLAEPLYGQPAAWQPPFHLYSPTPSSSHPLSRASRGVSGEFSLPALTAGPHPPFLACIITEVSNLSSNISLSSGDVSEWQISGSPSGYCILPASRRSVDSPR